MTKIVLVESLSETGDGVVLVTPSLEAAQAEHYTASLQAIAAHIEIGEAFGDTKDSREHQV